MDGIPPFKRKGISLVPSESFLLNLAPWLRVKVKHIMLHFLMPSTLKEREQKKYFDYMVVTDLNPLASAGIPHPTIVGRTIRVTIFSTTLDLPGKDKLFWLRGSLLPVCAPNNVHSHNTTTYTQQTTPYAFEPPHHVHSYHITCTLVTPDVFTPHHMHSHHTGILSTDYIHSATPYTL